jgi:hypothetical protein
MPTPQPSAQPDRAGDVVAGDRVVVPEDDDVVAVADDAVHAHPIGIRVVQEDPDEHVPRDRVALDDLALVALLERHQDPDLPLPETRLCRMTLWLSLPKKTPIPRPLLSRTTLFSMTLRSEQQTSIPLPLSCAVRSCRLLLAMPVVSEPAARPLKNCCSVPFLIVRPP